MHTTAENKYTNTNCWFKLFVQKHVRYSGTVVFITARIDRFSGAAWA